MTFEWEDIIDKVQFASYRADDMVTAITEEGQEYLFEFDELDTLEKQQEILERFLGEITAIDELNTDSKDFRETEKWLHKWLPFAYIYVRKDFFEDFFSEFKKQSVKRYPTALDTARKLLNPQSKLPRMVILQQRQYEKWEALTFELHGIKEIDEMIRKTERDIIVNKENHLKEGMSLDEFKAHLDAFMAELEKNKEYEEPIKLKFEWKNITDEIVKNIVFVEFKRSDIHLPCCINAITDEGLEYFAELNESKKEDDVLELFLGDNTEQYTMPKDTKGFHVSGKWLYNRISGSQTFVRADFFDRFISEYVKRNKDRYSALNTARKLLNPEGKQPRMIHSHTLAEWDL